LTSRKPVSFPRTPLYGVSSS